MHVVDTLFRNFVEGNSAARRVRYWFINVHKGMLLQVKEKSNLDSSLGET